MYCLFVLDSCFVFTQPEWNKLEKKWLVALFLRVICWAWMKWGVFELTSWQMFIYALHKQKLVFLCLMMVLNVVKETFYLDTIIGYGLKTFSSPLCHFLCANTKLADIIAFGTLLDEYPCKISIWGKNCWWVPQIVASWDWVI